MMEPVTDAPDRPEQQPDADGVASTDEVTVRRAPKIGVFLIMGALAGVLVSLILTSLFPFDQGQGVASTYGYFALWGLTFGGALGAVVAVVIDQVSSRRARRLQASRERVDAPDAAEVEGELE